MKKRAVSVILAGLMAASLAACGSSSSSGASTTAATEAATTAATEAAETAATEAASTDASVDLSQSKYLSDGVMTVGLNATFPPFEYVGDGTDTFDDITSNEGNVTGFDVAMMNEIGKRIGVTVEIEDMDFDGIIPALGSKIDVAATGMTITDERKESVNFSDPYYDATQSVLVSEDSTIATTEDDLKNASAIGVQAGTTGETVARGINDAATVSVKSFNQAVADLVNGKNDAVILDQVPAEAFATSYSGQLDTEQYGIAMPKDDEVMLNAINGALAAMKADGTYDTLVEQYISSYSAE